MCDRSSVLDSARPSSAPSSHSSSLSTATAAANNNINNSYPFDHEEFVAGYKSVNPNAKTMLDECKTPEQRLKMLEIMQMAKNG